MPSVSVVLTILQVFYLCSFRVEAVYIDVLAALLPTRMFVLDRMYGKMPIWDQYVSCPLALSRAVFHDWFFLSLSLARSRTLA